ncbi:MAG: hypothetical protein U1E70_27930 [Acetobacteraceae bacterium]
MAAFFGAIAFLDGGAAIFFGGAAFFAAAFIGAALFLPAAFFGGGAILAVAFFAGAFAAPFIGAAFLLMAAAAFFLTGAADAGAFFLPGAVTALAMTSSLESCTRDSSIGATTYCFQAREPPSEAETGQISNRFAS